MPISLPPELEAFALREIEAGKYGSIEELLVDAVRALSDRQEDIYQGRFEELQAEVQVGIDALVVKAKTWKLQWITCDKKCARSMECNNFELHHFQSSESRYGDDRGLSSSKLQFSIQRKIH